ncbi:MULTISPECIES: hypothetical protein [unclassified Methanoregula]|uniref:hypothetical protein n=1 Tax=unclassified Methanoregula TaxID=2649730 RepID=UPI0009CBCFEB|nr:MULTISPECIES: hypothetical protein [unclassified Methanoregula]OPX63622.1 MAG: hypothetical protein A4E33_01557 [Methanoregula sp. PtaB.Bin085]OPY36212.1 MAG: hypothetical protein A4E34_00390 [Methanoregula sp. PtaU1.Bin006]
MTGQLSPDALMRAVVMLIVASAVGTIVEQKQAYLDQVAEKNRALSDANEKLRAVRAQLVDSLEACETAKRK